MEVGFDDEGGRGGVEGGGVYTLVSFSFSGLETAVRTLT